MQEPAFKQAASCSRPSVVVDAHACRLRCECQPELPAGCRCNCFRPPLRLPGVQVADRGLETLPAGCLDDLEVQAALERRCCNMLPLPAAQCRLTQATLATCWLCCRYRYR